MSRAKQAPPVKTLLLTRNEAARTLNICTKQLDQLTRARRIRALRIGARVYYKPEFLETFIESLPERESVKQPPDA